MRIRLGKNKIPEKNLQKENKNIFIRKYCVHLGANVVISEMLTIKQIQIFDT